ncbi:hypothetical protein SPMU_24070 [Sphingomonas mucosissima]|uniref:Uncharacterized protein n=1 Tax=Sphingomonas mucosissima TaxID=370959 RepID=A0A245ZJT8_9SPHN|nr:hypothetical protein SPMU_24070 [Sphingomonas mucosissima]
MSYVFVTNIGNKYLPCAQKNVVLLPAFTIMHPDCTIEHDEDFRTVIDVPSIWLIRPMQANGCPFDFSNVPSAPCTFRCEALYIVYHRRHIIPFCLQDCALMLRS